MDREKVIAWLADEELYYRDHGDTHNSLMACNALALLKEQQKQIETIEDKRAKTTMLLNYMLQKEREQPQIVRCKECKYSLSNSRFCAYPHKKNNIQPCDWFCADGERKDNG